MLVNDDSQSQRSSAVGNWQRKVSLTRLCHAKQEMFSLRHYPLIFQIVSIAFLKKKKKKWCLRFLQRNWTKCSVGGKPFMVSLLHRNLSKYLFRFPQSLENKIHPPTSDYMIRYLWVTGRMKSWMATMYISL